MHHELTTRRPPAPPPHQRRAAIASRRAPMLRLVTAPDTAADPVEGCPVCRAASNLRCCEYGRDR